MSRFSSISFSLRRSLATAVIRNPQVAIIGSGPAGFYTAQQIFKGHETAEVDIYERLPVPFGLVRFGIAPDHPDVKNCISTFNQIAKNKRFRFFGNVNVGTDVNVDELRNAYSAVVFAYGAADDKMLGIPGEDLKGVYSARSFVAWYNGLPGLETLNPNLDTDSVVVLGQGNVAIDVARILLTPVDILRTTDITEHSLASLCKSRVKRVHVVGRRGPLQVAFTPAELREMVKLPDCRPVFSKTNFEEIRQKSQEIPRARKRLTELMVRTALDEPDPEDSARWANARKEFHLKFLRSPSKFLPNSDSSGVKAVQFDINRLEGDRAISTGQTEELQCGLVLRSIGYRSQSLDGHMPFDSANGVVPNKLGRVTGCADLYCSGWVKRGPIGVLATTMNDAFETGKYIVEDLLSKPSIQDRKSGRDAVIDILRQKGVTVVKFEDWEKIDATEKKHGKEKGKPREKIYIIPEMLSIAKN